MTSNRSSVG